MLNLTAKEYYAMKELEGKILEALKDAVTSGASASDAVGRDIAMMHKEWLAYTWPSYDPRLIWGWRKCTWRMNGFNPIMTKNSRDAPSFFGTPSVPT